MQRKVYFMERKVHALLCREKFISCREKVHALSCKEKRVYVGELTFGPWQLVLGICAYGFGPWYLHRCVDP